MYLLHPYVCMHLLVCVCMHACMYTTTTVSMRCMRHMDLPGRAPASARLLAGPGKGVYNRPLRSGIYPLSRMTHTTPREEVKMKPSVIVHLSGEIPVLNETVKRLSHRYLSGNKDTGIPVRYPSIRARFKLLNRFGNKTFCTPFKLFK